MTKEEALKILKDCRQRGFDRTTYYIDEYHTARDMAIRALEEQETVELSEHVIDAIANAVVKKMQEPKWIPVSERMPEKNGNYLITYCYRNEYCHRDEIETDVAAYVYDEDEDEDKWYDITDIEITLAVIAWMPLPEPYTAESEG